MTSSNLIKLEVSDEPHQNVPIEERSDPNINVEVEQVMALVKPQTLEEESDKKPMPTATGNLFSQEDDITLLQGFIRFRAENGTKNDWVKFHTIIRDKLSHHRFTKTQVSEKMRRLRSKFLKRPADQISNPHDSQVFELSKVLWNDQVISLNNSSTSKRKMVDSINENDGETASKKQNTRQEFETKFPHLDASFKETRFPLFVKENWFSLVGIDKAQELEDRLRKLKVDRLQLNQKMHQLVLKHTMKALAANKSGLLAE